MDQIANDASVPALNANSSQNTTTRDLGALLKY
jgi:hypothetical protein